MTEKPDGVDNRRRDRGRATVSVPGRFYAVLAGAKQDDADSRRQYRRQTMALLQAISSRLQKIAAASAAGTGLHATDLFVVGLIYRTTADHVARVSDVQRGLGITAGGMTRRLDSMVKRGLVVREADPDDGRAWLVRLTAQGAELAERLYASAAERNQRLQAEFSDEEWRTMIGLLQRLDGLLE